MEAWEYDEISEPEEDGEFHGILLDGVDMATAVAPVALKPAGAVPLSRLALNPDKVAPRYLPHLLPSLIACVGSGRNGVRG